jgi:hypothetical protein
MEQWVEGYLPAPCTIRVSTGHVTVDAMVHEQTGMAYHRVPRGTVLYEQLPGCYMVSDLHGNAVTCNPLPDDDRTARLVIEAVAASPGENTQALIERLVIGNHGNWQYLPEEEDR